MKNKIAGHTPGPWSADGAAVDSDKYAVATVHFSDGEGPEEREARANARLIAAAPDMARRIEELEAENKGLREACEAITEAFVHKPGDTAGNKARTAPLKYANAEFSAALTKIRAALSRRKGEK